MNYAVIHFLEERLTSQLSLFEYGAGYSTLFFAGLVDTVVSVESNLDWFRTLQPMCPESVTLIHKSFEPDSDYCRLVNTDNKKYDVVVIDGWDRARCVISACSALTDSGVILIDDTSRESYLESGRVWISLGAGLPGQGFEPVSEGEMTSHKETPSSLVFPASLRRWTRRIQANVALSLVTIPVSCCLRGRSRPIWKGFSIF